MTKRKLQKAYMLRGDKLTVNIPGKSTFGDSGDLEMEHNGHVITIEHKKWITDPPTIAQLFGKKEVANNMGQYGTLYAKARHGLHVVITLGDYKSVPNEPCMYYPVIRYYKPLIGSDVWFDQKVIPFEDYLVHWWKVIAKEQKFK